MVRRVIGVSENGIGLLPRQPVVLSTQSTYCATKRTSGMNDGPPVDIWSAENYHKL